ncbi:hypothetical protein RUND412_010017 [Rhizina undulata]
MTSEDGNEDSFPEEILQQIKSLGVDPTKIDPDRFQAAAKELEQEEMAKAAKAAEDGEEDGEDVGVEPEKKKKKKKRKSKSQRKFPPPTGFEEYWVDGPLSPEKVAEELELYSSQKPFSERIELCIQRYKAKRKFDPTRIQIFTEYLNLGGVSSGPKQFSGGLDLKNNDDMDAEQIQQMAATDYVRQDDDDDELEVDFEYVARGFLSHRIPYVMGYMKMGDLQLSARVVRNFLNYVIYHNVAPEYEYSVRDAIKICDLADKELCLTRHVSSRLPGDFNTACSTLFQGFYAGMRDDSYTWDSGPAAAIGLTEEEAKKIYLSGLSERGTAIQQERGINVKVISREFLSLEVVDIIFPGRETEGGTGLGRGVKALGKLILKVWVPEGDEWPETQLDEFEIWLEKEVLQWTFVGMKMEARVHCLSSGVIWIDNVTAVKCSFYLHVESPVKSDLKESEIDDDFD